MKHDNVSMHDAFVWNWSKSEVCDDPIFITSCINDAIGDEISRGAGYVRGTNLVEFQSCIGFINGTFINIQKP